jgi:hypothetical protein
VASAAARQADDSGGAAGALAQLGERRLCTPGVTDSIPIRSIFSFPLAAYIAIAVPRLAPDFLGGTRAADDRDESSGKVLVPERVGDARVEPAQREERRHRRRVDEHVLVPLVVAAPGAVLGADERRNLAHEAILGRPRDAGDHRPVVTDTASSLARRQVVAIPPIQ